MQCFILQEMRGNLFVVRGFVCKVFLFVFFLKRIKTIDYEAYHIDYLIEG